MVSILVDPFQTNFHSIFPLMEFYQFDTRWHIKSTDKPVDLTTSLFGTAWFARSTGWSCKQPFPYCLQSFYLILWLQWTALVTSNLVRIKDGHYYCTVHPLPLYIEPVNPKWQLPFLANPCTDKNYSKKSLGVTFSTLLILMNLVPLSRDVYETVMFFWQH